MLDALIMTLGFEPGPLVSAVAKHLGEGFNPNAEIIILTPTFSDERAERAWRELQNIFEMMKPKDSLLHLKKIEIDLTNCTKAILQVKSILSGFREKKVHISLTGGMRALILATYIACLLTKWVSTPEVDISLEGKGLTLRIPKIASILRPVVSYRKLELLRYMEPGVVYKLDDLCGFLPERDRSTIYRYLREMTEIGLIERKKRGFKLTELGEIMKPD